MRALRLGAAALVVVTAIALGASPASAHTSLVSSTPADRSILPQAPGKISLEFANAVDPRLVSVEVVDTAGAHHPGAKRLTPDRPDTKTVEFSLPALRSGTYGVTWQSIGPDGHRVSGEVVFGVGVGQRQRVASARFRTSSLSDRAFEVSGGVGRFVWYAGLSLVVGALYGLWWLARARDRAGPAEHALDHVARRVLAIGLWVALAGVAIRWATTVAVLSGSYGGGRSAKHVMDAITSSNGTLGLLALLATVGVVGLCRPLADATATPAPETARLGGAAAGLAAGALLLAIGGHASIEANPSLAVGLDAAHVLAAGAWLGPLALVLAAGRSRPWRALDRTTRSAALQRFFSGYAAVAGWSFAVLVVTGLRPLWLNAASRLTRTDYGLVLLAKLGLVLAVIAPLGWYHDGLVRRRERRAGPPAAAKAVGAPAFGRTLALEAGALVVVLALAAALAGLNPGSRRTATPTTALASRSAPADQVNGSGLNPLSTKAATDPSQCASLAVGKSDCYRGYLDSIMRKQDAGAALVRVQQLSATDPYVRSQCHQITHDLGRDAILYYKSLAKALSFEGSVCWSGYYHGVVEERLSKWDDAKLKAQVPTVCAEAAKRRYSFTHYNCLHGVGHGLMLRFNADLFRALPYCQTLTDTWEKDSCVSGVFMQNIVSAEVDHVPGTFKPDDLLYPCDAVANDIRHDCYLIHTSYMLWKTASDYTKVFSLCDRVTDGLDKVCYQSMGRDISGSYLLDVPAIISHCNMGQPALRSYCYVGASLNAVYNDHATANATKLCDAVDPQYRSACTAARDQAASTL